MKPTEDLFEYYKNIWESKKKSGRNPSEAAWDSRAEDWEKERKKRPGFFSNLDSRVSATAEFLRGYGLLGAGSRVADIGCGPGRFAVEFARTAEAVTCLDISSKMLQMGRVLAEEKQCENISFLQADFSELDVEKAGWEGAYDLVFASLTPALGTLPDLEKLMKISRGYCFNSSFVRWDDELEREIGRELFGRDGRVPGRGRDDWFYAFFNLIWLMGYYPETSYYCRSEEVTVSADEDQARYYAKCFSGDMMADEESTARVLRYLKKRADENGQITFKEDRWYGWILWDVRKKTVR